MKSIIDPPSPFASAAEWRDFEAQMKTMPPEDVKDFAYLGDVVQDEPQQEPRQ